MIFVKFISRYFSSLPPRLKLLLVVLCLALGTTQGVLAHSELVNSEPDNGQVLSESPAQVKARFSEELEPNQSTIQVSDSQGEQVDQGDSGIDLNDVEHTLMVVSLPASLPADTYTVSWTATSADDGDTTSGAFSFIVGNAQTNTANSLEAGGSSDWGIGIFAIIILVSLVILIILARSPIFKAPNTPSDRSG